MSGEIEKWPVLFAKNRDVIKVWFSSHTPSDKEIEAEKTIDQTLASRYRWPERKPYELKHLTNDEAVSLGIISGVLIIKMPGED